MKLKSLLKSEKGFIRQSSVILTILILAPVISQDEFFAVTLCLSLVWGIMGLGWNVVGGYAGQTSNGHAMYFGIGAYVGALGLKWYGLSPWLTMWIAVIL
ncbi:MAG: branched-chain amino acid ABC transporter permease, partial [Ruminococcaceae bacterium]|nr:branched-chain amino acid ABC transporter permease [Oscillospiraceae bacterium]